MRAVEVQTLDGPDAVAVVDHAEPPRDRDGVLIEVHAAGVSFPDLLLSKGEYQLRMEPPFVLGVEVAGVVREVRGEAAVAPGDRVCAFMYSGGMAELALVRAADVFPMPDELSFREGAGLVLNYHTAHFALERRAALRAGERVLVHGAAGGVGTAAIQVARGLGASSVIAVVSTDAKGEIARAAGADAVVRSDGPWRERVRELTGGAGVDVVLDPVGGDRFTDSLRSLAGGGRLAVVGFTEGSIPAVRVNRLLLANTSVVGVAWGAYIAERPQVAHAISDGVNTLVRAGHVRPIVGEPRPLEQAADALRALEQRTATGKLVLDVR